MMVRSPIQSLSKLASTILLVSFAALQLGCPGGGSGGGTTAAPVTSSPAPTPPGPVTATLAVDTTQRHQTWLGFEVASEVYHRDSNDFGNLGLDQHPVDQLYIDRVLDDAVDQLGITSIDFANALMKFSNNRQAMEPTNDNADPFVLDSSKIRWSWFDPYVRAVLLPLKQRVEARGETFVWTLSVHAWDAYQWHEPAGDPGQEYAEFVMACLDRLSVLYGVHPTFLSVYNEPDNVNASETPSEVIRGIKKLVARMQAAGYSAKIRFPDVSFIENAIVYFDLMQSTEPQLLNSLGGFSFHGYSNPSFPRSELDKIVARSNLYSIPTVQSEWWFTNYHPPDIYTAMTFGNVNQYQPYGLAYPHNSPNTKGLYGYTYTGADPLYNHTGFHRLADWYEIYQYSAFIRPGDVRVDISSTRSEIKPVAFQKPDGRVTTVVLNESGSQHIIALNSLPTGTYSITITSPTQQGEEQPVVAHSAPHPLYVVLPANSVTSIYKMP